MNGVCTEQLKISNEKTTMGSVFRSKMVNLVKLSCITNAFLVKSFLQKSILIKFMSRIIIWSIHIRVSFYKITGLSIQYENNWTGYFQKKYPRMFHRYNVIEKTSPRGNSDDLRKARLVFFLSNCDTSGTIVICYIFVILKSRI